MDAAASSSLETAEIQQSIPMKVQQKALELAELEAQTLLQSISSSHPDPGLGANIDISA